MTQPAPNIHATLLCIEKKGLLLTGPSGAGKSDLALRVLTTHFSNSFCAAPPELVTDDQVILRQSQGKLYGRPPEAIKGLLEVRGVGICHFPNREESQIHGVIVLTPNQQPERLPSTPFATIEIETICLPTVQLNPFEQSAPQKLVLLAQNFGK